MSTASQRQYKSVSTGVLSKTMSPGRSNSLKYLSWVVVSIVGDSRSSSTTTRPDPSRLDTKLHSNPHQSSLPTDRSHASDQERYTRTPGLRKYVSSGSTSSSEYSSASQNDSKDPRPKPGVSSKLRRRSGDRSEGGSDRRRLAIVQMDTESKRKSSSQPHGDRSIRSRRGLQSDLAGLALVAPPDAALNSYTHLTPPSTAPITGDMIKRDSSDGNSKNTREGKGHHKTSSEGLHSKARPPRDVGIVGTGRPSLTKDAFQGGGSKLKDGLHPPIFQQPHSRSSSPGSTSDISDPMRNLLSPVLARLPNKKRSTEDSLIVTPKIGQEKDVSARVAAPVVMSLESAQIFQTEKHSSHNASPTPNGSAPQIVVQSVPASTTAFPPTDTSPYLHYQPGQCIFIFTKQSPVL